ncbi:unnamed protein product [Adineta steineri]|uniref:Uncharacterized protein n=1 Tax=Adineta steineri TaxID=433720 RepID=A0A813ZK30_9BILA|nr:unnamed protein product [Adineta steineri]CAF0899041.1 unnamed protein product [Adineta steineri]CAF3564643.1 unnamed protein product [Adineta steineri]CAF3919898.1 unnamed protein product [Adineta steineri]
MSFAYSNSRQFLNNSEKPDSTTIRRTIIEHGVRPVENDNKTQSGQSATDVAMKTITKQHQDEQRELQELNNKLSTYIDHVQRLENRNADLSAVVEDLKRKWGGDAAQLHALYGPDLKTLREAIDDSQYGHISQELKLKRFEYDINQAKQLIAAFDGIKVYDLNGLQQELNMSIQELENITDRFNRQLELLDQQRTNLANFHNELDNLQNELMTHQLESITVESELQTLKELIAFEDALYQAQREELLSITTPLLDVSNFYRNELTRAILDIRQDFDVLQQSQAIELEEYYRMKIEHLQQEVAEDNERKRLLNMTNETVDKSLQTSSWKDLDNIYQQLKIDNHQLQGNLDALSDDLAKIQEEHIREREILDRELNQLRDELSIKQETIDNMLGNNISLRFELSTYRRLLNSEEQRLNRLDQQQQQQQQLTNSSVLTSSSLSSTLIPSSSSRPPPPPPSPSSSSSRLPPSSSSPPPPQLSSRPPPPSSRPPPPPPPSSSSPPPLSSSSSRLPPSSSSSSPPPPPPPPSSRPPPPPPSSSSPPPSSSSSSPPPPPPSSSSSIRPNQHNPVRRESNLTVQKMAIKKASQGPIIFDSVDFANDCVIIIYDRYAGNEESLGNWIIRHENDQQAPQIYQFPSSFVLRPRQTVRIVSKLGSQSIKSGNDVLIADQIDTWGQGQVVITRLIDANRIEKANITHTRVPA